MTETILNVEELTKSYSMSEGTIQAVDGIDFSVDRGEIVGILGPNGAGKTTTIKCILGLVAPSRGSITINGIDTSAEPRAAYKYVAGVLEGARNVYWRLTVRENLRFFVGSQGIHPNKMTGRYDQVISKVGLEDKADEEVKELSRGMKQKVSLACALIQDPELLFLDEPTLGLDVKSSIDLQREIHHLAKTENRTVILSSHNMQVVQELCDRVIIFKSGEIIASDTVENMTGMFQRQAYEISFVSGTEPFDKLDNYDYDVLEDRAYPTAKIIVSGSKELYDLMSKCDEVGAEIEQIKSVEPDLEDVFLSVIETTDRKPKPQRIGETQ